MDILARLSQARSCDGTQADGDVRRALQVVVAHAAGAAAIVLVQVLDAPPAPPQDWVDMQLQPLQQPPRRRDGVAVDATVAERVERHTPPAPAAWVLRLLPPVPVDPQHKKETHQTLQNSVVPNIRWMPCRFSSPTRGSAPSRGSIASVKLVKRAPAMSVAAQATGTIASSGSFRLCLRKRAPADFLST